VVKPPKDMTIRFTAPRAVPESRKKGPVLRFSMENAEPSLSICAKKRVERMFQLTGCPRKDYILPALS
jgi:hypothetical protein